MKNIIKTMSLILAVLMISVCFYGCQNETSATANNATKDEASQLKTTASQIESDIDIDINDIEGSIDLDSAYKITLNGNSATAQNNCAEIDGSKVTIKNGGVYVISGTLSDGQIKVSAENQTVVVVLNGVDITNKSGAAIHIKKALSAYVVSLSGTKNTVSDTQNYEFSSDDTDGEPDATIFSKSDLIIGGKGTLNVNANYSTGIKSKDSLVITDTTLNLTSVDDGIKGRDLLEIIGGNITVNAENDGIKTTNDTEEEKGDINITGGTINITAGTDAIQSERNINISEGDITVTTSSGAQNTNKNNFGVWGNSKSDDSKSAKGIKAENTIDISGGTININSADDAIHSNNAIVISGGELSLASGDDAIHADSELDISGGTINITNSYEGIEASVISVSNGDINITSSDDGINAGGGNDSSQSNGFGGGDRFATDSNAMINVTGGYIYINAQGDGFDSNGNAEMIGGTLIIDGPTNDGNGALDYNGTFNMTGGLLVATGSSGMAQAVSDSSSQYCIMATVSSQKAGSVFSIQNTSGEEIVTYAPSKAYTNIIVCSPDIKNGESYTIYTGGSASGDSKNGLYTNGSYSGGTKQASITISSIVTSYGFAGTGGMKGNIGGEMNGGPNGNTNDQNSNMPNGNMGERPGVMNR